MPRELVVAYLTSAKLEGRSATIAPPNRGVFLNSGMSNAVLESGRLFQRWLKMERDLDSD